MTVYQVRFEGPATLALRVVTALADADGVELTSSGPPSALDANTVELAVAIEGEFDAVADAIAGIRGGLPEGASLEIADG